jgi:hypothetical protein
VRYISLREKKGRFPGTQKTGPPRLGELRMRCGVRAAPPCSTRLVSFACPARRAAVLRDRALCLLTFSPFLIVNKTSLPPACQRATSTLLSLKPHTVGSDKMLARAWFPSSRRLIFHLPAHHDCLVLVDHHPRPAANCGSSSSRGFTKGDCACPRAFLRFHQGYGQDHQQLSSGVFCRGQGRFHKGRRRLRP